jgi:hypothetical protein
MSTKTILTDQLAKYDFSKWTPIPLKGRSKKPLDNNWTKREYNARAVIEAAERNGHNVGIRLRDDQLIVDVDLRNGGAAGFIDLCIEYGLDSDKWPHVVTGSGGSHYYLTKPAGVKIVNELDAFPGVEFKSVGRQVVAAGSIHSDTGKPYLWDEKNPPLEEAPECPAALLKAITRPEIADANAYATSGGEYTPEQLRKALEGLDVTQFRDHDKWLQLMMAAHSATNGLACEEFVEFSTSDPLYADHAEEIRKRWESLNTSKPGGITFRTLNHILREHGAANRQAPAVIEPNEFPEDDSWLEGGEHEVIAIEDRGLRVNNAGRAPDNYANAVAAVGRSGLEPSWDELKQNVVFRAKHLPWDEAFGRVLDDHVLRLTRVYVMQRHQGNDYQPSLDHLLQATLTLAYMKKFNPITDWLASLKWDGKPRVAQLFGRYFNCGHDAYTRGVSVAFMIGAVRRVRNPGSKFDTVPILKGAQGVGKSTGVATLFGREWTSDADLGSLRDKDSALKLRGIWCQELAELESMSRAETGQLKAFLSRATDRQRDPYDRTVKDVPRRCVFVGTGNESGFLKDSTGARRFWSLTVAGPINTKLIEADRDQLWAEAAALEARGMSDVLPPELWPIAAERQADETTEDPWADTIREYLEDRKREYDSHDDLSDDPGPEPQSPDRVHVAELFHALEIKSAERTKDKAQRLRTVMEASLGWHYRRSLRIGARAAKGYARRA